MASITLWLIVSFILHAYIEIWLINKFFQEGINPVLFNGRCYLPVGLQIILIISGIVFGYIIGERWWNIVYVEKRHWRFRKK
jgi:hypothetical protein